MLRDPATNRIPPGIRRRELAYASSLRQSAKGLRRKALDVEFAWKEAGPSNVGGRTRALGVDVNNPDVIIAGGVSGGIWKSIDGGATWHSKSDPSHTLSITSVAQDPRVDHTNLWYYATGEFTSSSASDRGFRAYFSGTGLYRSTDNGETWRPIHAGSNPTIWDSPFDYVSRIVVSPQSGTIFLASNGFGIYRSEDGGDSFDRVLGGAGDHKFVDVAMASDGSVISVLSEEGWNDPPQNVAGVYISVDDGLHWTDITPVDFPTSHQRSVLASAPSNPGIVYVLTFTGEHHEDGREDVRFYKINTSTSTSEDRSANLPVFDDSQGHVRTQSNYNMVIAVKPDDEDFVLVGGTSLFRSTTGFSSAPGDTFDTWVGGYHPRYISDYPNQHPDQHVMAFDPTDANKMWAGHDGGLSFTPDVTASSSSSHYLPWENKNDGYNVTQFYTVTIPDEPNDNRIMGGTQDNGTPFIRWDGSTASPSTRVTYGDGCHVYFGDDFAYTSFQEGGVYRVNYDPSGNPSLTSGWSLITPKGASGQLFVNPFVVDPNDEDVMYYPAGGDLWRNDRLAAIPYYQDSTSIGWEKLSKLSVPSGYDITVLSVSRGNPVHLLYYGASSWEEAPKLFSFADAHADTAGSVEISIPEAPNGAYVHSIAINPSNSDEILVVLSNYNIVGLYHSENGGETYVPVEGNLEGDANLPGPSLRSATILPMATGTVYIVGTSTGVYSSMELKGSDTVWQQEGSDEIGNVVVEYVASRQSDGRVALGTHGRGVFIGDPVSTVDITVLSISEQPDVFSLGPNYPNPFNLATTIRFYVPSTGPVVLTVYDLLGKRVGTILDKSFEPGHHEVEWNAGNISSGIYFLRMQAGDPSKGSGQVFTRTRKVTLLR